MRRLLYAIVFCLLFASPLLAQTNPCATPKPAFTVVNTFTLTVHQKVDDYGSLFGGNPVVTDVDVAAFALGADPNGPTVKPVAMASTAKASWTLNPGTADCYRASVALTGLSDNTEYDLYVRKRGAQVGPWNVAVERVPFGRPGPPSAATGIRVTP